MGKFVCTSCELDSLPKIREGDSGKELHKLKKVETLRYLNKDITIEYRERLTLQGRIPCNKEDGYVYVVVIGELREGEKSLIEEIVRDDKELGDAIGEVYFRNPCK